MKALGTRTSTLWEQGLPRLQKLTGSVQTNILSGMCPSFLHPLPFSLPSLPQHALHACHCPSAVSGGAPLSCLWKISSLSRLCGKFLYHMQKQKADCCCTCMWDTALCSGGETERAGRQTNKQTGTCHLGEGPFSCCSAFPQHLLRSLTKLLSIFALEAVETTWVGDGAGIVLVAGSLHSSRQHSDFLGTRTARAWRDGILTAACLPQDICFSL